MKSSRLLALLFAILLVAAACGGGDEGSDQPDPGSDQTTEGDSGNAGGGQPMASGNLPSSVPDDFPIAIPSGWEVDFNADIGLTTSATRLFYSADAYDDIVAFYEDWTAAQPDDYTRAEGPEGTVFTRAASPPYVISIVPNHEEQGETWTLLTASGSADG